MSCKQKGELMTGTVYAISQNSPQEELYDLGRVLHSRSWTDADIQNIFCQHYRYWFINLAKAFYVLKSGLLMRAMCEEWTPEQIAVACGIDPEEIPEKNR